MMVFSSISSPQVFRMNLFPKQLFILLNPFKGGSRVDFIQTNLINHTNYKVILIKNQWEEGRIKKQRTSHCNLVFIAPCALHIFVIRHHSATWEAEAECHWNARCGAAAKAQSSELAGFCRREARSFRFWPDSRGTEISTDWLPTACARRPSPPADCCGFDMNPTRPVIWHHWLNKFTLSVNSSAQGRLFKWKEASQW